MRRALFVGRSYVTLPRTARSNAGTWDSLTRFAANPTGSEEQWAPFARKAEAQRTYDDYKAWCEARGVSVAEDIVDSVEWVDACSAASHRVGLEPSWAPYNLASDIEHWVLWHHPNDIPGHTDLAPSSEEAIVKELLQRFGGTATARPEEDQLVTFQNIPLRRSVSDIAHSHVFFRLKDGASDTELELTLSMLRRRWQQRALDRRRAL